MVGEIRHLCKKLKSAKIEIRRNNETADRRMEVTMYHCNLIINIISKEDWIKKELCVIPSLERFEHAFIMSDAVNIESVAKADLIIWDIESETERVEEQLHTIENMIKPGADIILCAGMEIVNTVKWHAFSHITDIWVKPYSKEYISLMFHKYQKLQLERKERWLLQNYLDALIDGIPDLVWFKDKIGSHLKVNDAFCETVNKTKNQVQGRGHYYIWDIEPEEYSKGEYICMESEEEVMEAKHTCVFEEKVKIRDEMRLLCTYKSPLFDLDGSVMGTVGLAHDITEDRRHQEQIMHSANTDFLTQLYNRRVFYSYLEEHKGEPMTILFMDLDYFKEINDKLGHDMGDAVLIKVADLLRKVFSKQLIARMGGDEFVVVFTGEYVMRAIGDKCDVFLTELRNAYKDNKDMAVLSASIGISKTDGKDKSADALMKESDAAMYEMKRRRKLERAGI